MVPLKISLQQEMKLHLILVSLCLCSQIYSMNSHFSHTLFFVGYVKEVAKNQKTKCGGCSKPMQQNDLAVFAPKKRDQVSLLFESQFFL